MVDSSPAIDDVTLVAICPFQRLRLPTEAQVVLRAGGGIDFGRFREDEVDQYTVRVDSAGTGL